MACVCMRACLAASHDLTFFTMSNRTLRSSIEMLSRGSQMPGLFWSQGNNNPPSTVGVSPMPLSSSQLSGEVLRRLGWRQLCFAVVDSLGRNR